MLTKCEKIQRVNMLLQRTACSLLLYLLTLLHSKTFKLSFFGESWSNLLSLHYLCVKPRCPQWILSARTTACNIFKTVRDTPSTGLHLVCRRPVLGCCYITFFLLHYKSYQLTLSYTRIATSKKSHIQMWYMICFYHYRHHWRCVCICTKNSP